jgi:SAM-dependent methyltransferase
MRQRCLLALLLLGIFVAEVCAQSSNFGEEVPYIRTPQSVVDKMLDLAGVGPNDFLIDLGSGDGRIVFTAAQQRGARGFGVELDPTLVDASNEAARKAGIADRAQFFARDLFETDIREATVLTMYLLPAVNLQLRPRILALKPGTRVVSHDWDMGEWQADEKIVLHGLNKPVMPVQASTAYLWIVPARAAGSWDLQLDGADAKDATTIEFAQRFQEISGIVKRARGRTLLQSAHLRGAEIRFAVIDETRRPSVPLQFFGRIYGDTMEGSTATGRHWSARRKTD